MSKISFTKLALKKQDAIKTITINEQTIEVKQYLPINDKVDLVTRIINNSNDLNNFANPLKVEVLLALEIVMAYTNITFTDKQKEDVSKLYDLLTENGVVKAVYEAIPEDELGFVTDSLWETIDTIYDYQNSAMGLVENISNNYDNLNLDLTKLQESIKDPNNLKLLKDVLTKLG